MAELLEFCANQPAIAKAVFVEVHAAGEIVPAFEVLDAVGGGAADLGHTAAF